jgi:hypothetical protein
MLLFEEFLGGGEFQLAVAPPYTSRLNAVGFGGSGAIRYVAVGDEGSVISSEDGKIWFKRVSTTATNLYDIKWISNYNYWLAAGRSTVCYSIDGITWNSYDIPIAFPGDIIKIMQTPYTKDYIHLQCFSGGYYKKQASYPSISSSSGWVNATNGWTPYIHSAGYEPVTNFMLFGGGDATNLHYTKNFTDYGGFNIPITGNSSEFIGDIVFDNMGGVMMVTGGENQNTEIFTTATSTFDGDGVAFWNSVLNPRAADFKKQPSLTTTGWNNIAFGDSPSIAYGETYSDRYYSVWVIVSPKGAIVYTTYPITNIGSYYLDNYYSYVTPTLYKNSGLTWTNANLPTITSPVYNGVTYGNRLFIAVGSYGLIVTSSDGVNWFTKNDNVTKTCVF